MEQNIAVLNLSPMLNAVLKDEENCSALTDNVSSLQDEKSPPAQILPHSPVPYTVFTQDQKRLLQLLLGFACLISPLTATVYLPLLPLLRSHFNTGAQAINLTIMIYIIFQALSPAVFGPISDSLGRRLVYIITLSLYTIGNLGLALNKSSYPALLVLRAIQSLGASAAQAISYGVVADVCIPSERGKMLGPVSMSLNLGACIGPTVGGLVSWSSKSYEWVFWSLVIFAVLLLVSIGFLLPETAREVVGNGSHSGEPRWWEISWLIAIKRLLSKTNHVTESTAKSALPCEKSVWQHLRDHNLFTCLRVMLHQDMFIVMWIVSLFYMVDHTVVASMPDIFKDIYHFNELQIGLAYIPRGAGVICSGYCTGKFMDHNYRTIARQIGWNIDKVAGDDLLHFPIEKARARGSYILLVIATVVMTGYGWAITEHAHVSIVLILQAAQGFMGCSFYNIYNTLLIDVFPESPSTAAAASSVLRCAMAAAGVAILQPALDLIGSRAWYFTILGLWSGICGALSVLLIEKKGMTWRTNRMMKKRSDSVCSTDSS